MFNDKNKFQRSNQNSKPKTKVNVQTKYGQVSKHESVSSIKSNEEEKSISINVPNYSVYSSGQVNEVQKVLIDKVELISFAQRFAQEKIALENMVTKLTEENGLMNEQIQRLREQKQYLQKLNQKSINQQNNTTEYYKAVQELKQKIKGQFERRLQAQKQLHKMEGTIFEIRKKNQFLEQKMKHKQDQVMRCEQLLRIKEEIIQNLQWQKANTVKTIDKEQKGKVYDEKQKGKRSIVIMDQSSLQSKGDYHNYQKVQANRYNNRSLEDLSQIKQTQQQQLQKQKQQQMNKTTINLMGTYYHGQGSSSIQKKQQPRYIISRKPSGGSKDSAKKLNISIYKNNHSTYINNMSQQQKYSKQKYNQKQQSNNNNDNDYHDKDIDKIKSFDKNKPKNIVLKKYLNNSCGSINQRLTKERGGDYQLKLQFQAKQQQYIRIIASLQSQIQSLKNYHLNKGSQYYEQSQRKSQPNALKLLISTNQQQPLQTISYQLLQKKYNMIKQKCLLLQTQIQKTIKKYIITQEKNHQLENIIQSLRTGYSENRLLEQQTYLQVDHQPSKPALSIQDLVTPQFRQSKFNNKFFHKDKKNINQNHFNQQNQQNRHNHSPFHQIHLQHHQNPSDFHLFNTFEKNDKKTPQQSKLSMINQRNEKSYQRNDLSRKFDQIQDVSQIVCRNQQSIAMGDTFDL